MKASSGTHPELRSAIQTNERPLSHTLTHTYLSLSLLNQNLISEMFSSFFNRGASDEHAARLKLLIYLKAEHLPGLYEAALRRDTQALLIKYVYSNLEI